MSEPFLGEIRLFSYNFAPRGWLICDGSLLSISQYQALFSILGTTYGGNGTTNFAIPDLKGRVPVHFGNGVTLGEKAGEADHTLTVVEMPMHNHMVNASSTATSKTTTGELWSASTTENYTPTANQTMHPQALTSTGNNQAHNNMQPYCVGNYCIAILGLFPPHN